MGFWARFFGKSETTIKLPKKQPTIKQHSSPPRGTSTQRSPRRAEFLSREDEERSFVIGPDGMPSGRLKRIGDRLLIVTDDGAGTVNPRSARIYSMGIYCFGLRGTAYQGSAIKRGDYRLGKSVRLVREPDNEHDRNAVAVYAAGTATRGGYVNKMNAKRIAVRLDRGEELLAISVRGDGPGKEDLRPVILVASPRVIAHLTR
ncbi:HIRAN domain-containing protein [Promicromonospora sp. MS192]|uniref:HIRAN domain-containing protein n=1 Tax=Promicromonospora sp. MS192 TaxID=3412684 RepID=UPI003C2DF117